MGKNRKMSINGKKLARNEQMDRKFMFMKIFWVQKIVCPCPGAIYMCITILVKQVYWFLAQVSGERLQDHWSSGYLSSGN